MHRRFVSYNLMAGGEGRADPIAEILLAKRPDVVGLHEASDNDVLRRVAARLSMAYVVAAGPGGRVALLTNHRILDVANLGAIYDSAMPILDATLDLDGVEIAVRVAHLTDRGEADRMAVVLAERLPDVMLLSSEAPMGLRVIDGEVRSAAEAAPATSMVPVRQLDQVVVAPDLKVHQFWIEQDRLAYYASDHLPGGAEIEWPPATVGQGAAS